MKILFLGGDKRQLEMIKILENKGYEVNVLGYQSINLENNVKKKGLYELKMDEYKVIIFPVSGVKSNYKIVSEFDSNPIFLPVDFLKNTQENVSIFTGIMTKELNEMLEVSKRKAISLMEDNNVKKENSIPTVEGIIADLVYSTDKTIEESNIFVLGYGNIGEVLVDKLKALKATSIAVGVIEQTDYEQLNKNNIKSLFTTDEKSMQQVIKESDVIINTVPELLLDKKLLNFVNNDAYILDISSYPYGVDFDYANQLKIKNKLFLGIPGKVAPTTAGRILVKKINDCIRRTE